MQALCDGLSASKIEAFARKWLRRVPHPFTTADQRAGYHYQLSIRQAEFSLTQALDRPVTGRVFFVTTTSIFKTSGRDDLSVVDWEIGASPKAKHGSAGHMGGRG